MCADGDPVVLGVCRGKKLWHIERIQKKEVRRQKTEDRRQKTEDRSQ